MCGDKVQVTLIADGPPDSHHTNSGVASGLLEALSRRDDTNICAAISTKFDRKQRITVRLLSARATRPRWDLAASWGLAAPLMRSAIRSCGLNGQPRSKQLVIHVRNVYLPSRYPYAAFIDMTHSLRRRHWPESGLNDRLYRRLISIERYYYRSASFVFTASEYVRQEVISHYGVPESRVFAVGGGIGCELASQSAPSPKSERNKVIFVGKDFRRKGGHHLLEAFRAVRDRLPNVELHIVGPDSAEIPSVPGVVTHGAIGSRGRMADLYSQSDVFCLPAIFEPFGLAVLEAMSFGLPVVASNVGVLPELVAKREAGLVVEVGAADQIATALLTVLTDPAKSDRMARNARGVAKEFTWDRVADLMLRSIKESRFSSAMGGAPA
jgi:glycosyltransferase involved in cell wall biosynthesis